MQNMINMKKRGSWLLLHGSVPLLLLAMLGGRLGPVITMATSVLGATLGLIWCAIAFSCSGCLRSYTNTEPEA